MLGVFALCTLQGMEVLGGGWCYLVRGLFQPDLWIEIDRTLAGPQKVHAAENREGALNSATFFCSAPQIAFTRGDLW
jgi:hypothetical protein